MKIVAPTILGLLSSKHSEDVFISECKTGSSSSYGGCPRLDAWVMRKSWANPCITGYEIKVDRSDFLNDKKWISYLPFCNEFYFVCPSKLIVVDEIPSNAGLLWVASAGTRLFIKKKAPYRDVEIPDSIFRYIMMWRSHIEKEGIRSFCSRDFWKNWMKEKEQKVNFGYQCGKRIQKVIEEKIDDVEKKNRILKNQIDQYDNVKETLKRLGFDPNTYFSSYQVNKKLEELVAGIPRDLQRGLTSLMESLSSFQTELNKLEEKN